MTSFSKLFLNYISKGAYESLATLLQEETAHLETLLEELSVAEITSGIDILQEAICIRDKLQQKYQIGLSLVELNRGIRKLESFDSINANLLIGRLGKIFAYSFLKENINYSSEVNLFCKDIEKFDLSFRAFLELETNIPIFSQRNLKGITGMFKTLKISSKDINFYNKLFYDMCTYYKIFEKKGFNAKFTMNESLALGHRTIYDSWKIFLQAKIISENLL